MTTKTKKITTISNAQPSALSYQEQITVTRLKKIQNFLHSLPPSCTDFVRSISMITSPLTRLAYVIDLNVFFGYLLGEISLFSDAHESAVSLVDEDINQISVHHLQGFIEYLTFYFKTTATVTDATEVQQKVFRNHESGVMRKLSTLRSYFEFLYREQRISGNVATLVSLPKLHEKPILHLQPNEVEKLLRFTQSGESLSPTQKKYHQLTVKRDFAILMMFLGTGMRVSECVGLNIEDIDHDAMGVLVTRKGGNQVVLYFPKEVNDALQDYITNRKQAIPKAGHENALFLSLQNKRISQRAVQIMVKKYSLFAAPLKKKMSPHKLRSTYATQLYHETEDIYLVADALGHSDVNTTRKHYAAISEKRRKEAAQNVHLPNVKGNASTPLKKVLEADIEAQLISAIQKEDGE